MYFYFVRLKCLLRTKQCIFWTFLFPLILGTLFHFAFNNLVNAEDFNTISVAVVVGTETGQEFVNAMKAIQTKSGKALFKVVNCEEEAAKKLLSKDEIKGYISLKDGMKLHVKASGLEETILKNFLDLYHQQKNVLFSISEQNEKAFSEGLAERLMESKSYMKDDRKENASTDYVVIYFYALIAMACLFGTTFGVNEIENLEANKSPRGARIKVSPGFNWKLIVSNFAAAITVHSFEMGIFLFYLRNILNVDFGKNFGYVLVVTFLGCTLSIFLGAAIAAIIKKNIQFTSSVTIVITMLGSFLSGLMIADIKYMVDDNAPIVNWINPAANITDALYCLFYYDNYEKFYIRIGVLIGMTILFGLIAVWQIRRKEYASL